MRMNQKKWLDLRWEDISPARHSRPPEYPGRVGGMGWPAALSGEERRCQIGIDVARNEPAMTFPRKTQKGFTLVEIMIVVAIIALLAAIAVPNFLRARKRSEASRILEDLRVLDNATDMYAIENNKTSGMNPAFTDLKAYIKTGTVLYTTGQDLFGDSYGPFTVDSVLGVPSGAFNDLSDVAPLSFWSPYWWSAGS